MINAEFILFRDLADHDEGEVDADALRFPRDHSGGRCGPARRRPHSRRAPAAYRPL